MSDVVLRLQHVNKVFEQNTPRAVHVLHDIDLELRAGELTALIGPSGSGKSTLLNLMGLLDTPSSGELWVDGQATAQLDDAGRTRLRAHHIGFVFQFHHLIGAFNVLDNVLMPLMLQQGKPTSEQLEYALYLLNAVGLGNMERRSAKALSGGQQQRVAIARALTTKPPIILADEPTGNLDSKNGEQVIGILRELHSEGSTVILITHDSTIARMADRVIRLLDGRIVHDSKFDEGDPFNEEVLHVSASGI